MRLDHLVQQNHRLPNLAKRSSSHIHRLLKTDRDDASKKRVYAHACDVTS
jgi:hypothetical protein